MPTVPPSFDPAPPAPTRASPTTFAARADAFLDWLVNFSVQIVDTALSTFTNATEAHADAVAADASAQEAGGSAVAAATSATTAATAVGAAAWVSGTTYAVGALVRSPANGFVYRRRVAGAGTTDPSSDPANWRVASTVELPLIVVSTATVTCQAGFRYVLSGAAQITATLPATLSNGDAIAFVVANGRTDNVVARAGHLIQGLAENMTIDDPNAAFGLVYAGAVAGLRIHQFDVALNAA